MRYDLVLAPEAIDDLRALRARDRATILDHLERHLRHTPERVSKSRIKRLRGIRHPQFRLRVGEFRIFYDVADEAVQILAIVAKSEAAEWLAREGEPP